MATVDAAGLKMKSQQNGYSGAKGRRFAFTVAGAFAVLAVVAYLRNRSFAFDVLGTLAIVLSFAGLVVPSRLQAVERAWMAFAHALSRVTTPIFMGIVYFGVLTPIAFIRRLAGGNPMVHKLKADSYWVTRPKSDPEAARKRMERQF